MPVQPRVGLVQDGARGHYGLAIALKRAGVLDTMFTDFFIGPGSFWSLISPVLRLSKRPVIRRLLDRKCAALSGAKVKTSLSLCLHQERQKANFAPGFQYFRWQATDTGQWIERNLPAAINVLVGFIHNIDSGLCRDAQQRGIRTVGDQMIAPSFVQKRELMLQMERFPGWENISVAEYADWIAFEQETWNVLDAVTCPSTYVAEGLVEGDVPRDKIHVINYPIDEKSFQFVDRSGPDRPKKIHVGFVGQIGLRKGAPYFLELARRFQNRDVQFTMIGSCNLLPAAKSELEKFVQLKQVPRSEVPQWLTAFDLIYFPTTCEGSAYALMEAMATGLPVVTSPNSGTVARHGQDGFIGPYDDLDFAEQSIERLRTDRDLRLAMGKSAAARYAEFNLDRYADNFKKLVHQLVNPAPVSDQR